MIFHKIFIIVKKIYSIRLLNDIKNWADLRVSYLARPILDLHNFFISYPPSSNNY